MATEKKAEEMASPSRHATPGLIQQTHDVGLRAWTRERSKESRSAPSVLTTNPEELGGLRDATHMLVYLNKETFVGPAGERFASELRLVQSDKKLKERVTLLLVHETRMEHGGCDFDRFFHVTPADLVRPPGDLFRTIATPLHAHERHVAVALSQLATTLGAKVKPSSHHPTPFDVASGALEQKESLKETTSSIENATATKVQAAWRGRFARKKLHKVPPTPVQRSSSSSPSRRWSFQKRPFSAPGRSGGGSPAVAVQIEEEPSVVTLTLPPPGKPAISATGPERARSVKIDEPESKWGLVRQATLGELDLVVADAPLADADQGSRPSSSNLRRTYSLKRSDSSWA